RNLLITSADGQTGHLLAELLLDPDSADDFHAQFTSLTCLTLDPSKCSDLEEAGAKIVEHVPGDKEGLVQAMKEGNIDTVVIIPPAKENKMELFTETVEAAVEAGTVVNTILLSSAGIDYADPKKHPRLTEFKEMEHMLMRRGKMNPDSETGNSPCIVRAGFYAENLLLYTKTSPELPLPVSENRAFAPLALGDLSLLLAHIAVGRGPNGLSDQHRGQLIIMTGPAMQTPTELAKTASEHAGKRITYTQSTPAEAKKLLENDTSLDEAEIEYLLEYWDLVEGCFTGYISTHAFHDITGESPQEMGEWWEIYGGEF
ncbi:NAD(P)-binding protein, partial [Saitoella complicata NRRL Y-17804]